MLYIFVADTRACLDSGGAAHEIFIDGIIGCFRELTRGIQNDAFRDLVAS